MRALLVISMVLAFCLTPFAADFSDFESIAISSPLISQIYTNPEISEVEDVQLKPEIQIMLYEELAGNICQALNSRYEDKISFTCFNDIKEKLDKDSYTEFNKMFTGLNDIEPEAVKPFAEKLQADGVLSTYLLFSYFENDKHKRNLELHLEWYLIDLSTGKVVISDEFDCKDNFDLSKAAEHERECFDDIAKYFAEMER